MEKVQLILASGSKWKIETMRKAGLKCKVKCSNIPENSTKIDVFEYTRDLAIQKAEAVSKLYNSGVIIGLDTVVSYKGKIIEKPKNLQEAKRVLTMLAGDTNSVITGICIIDLNHNKRKVANEETKLTFRNMSRHYIDYYIKNESDILNSAGYVIDGTLSCFVKKIEGTQENILGAPIYTIYEILEQMGYTFEDFI